MVLTHLLSGFRLSETGVYSAGYYFQVNILQPVTYPLRLNLLDASGKLVRSTTVPDARTQIATGDLAAGFYLVDIRSMDGQSARTPLIIR